MARVKFNVKFLRPVKNWLHEEAYKTNRSMNNILESLCIEKGNIDISGYKKSDAVKAAKDADNQA